MIENKDCLEYIKSLDDSSVEAQDSININKYKFFN